jgi:hypothetical protein
VQRRLLVGILALATLAAVTAARSLHRTDRHEMTAAPAAA